MPSNDRVAIEVGLNESVMRSANPHIPYSPEEIARDARDCYNAGAAVVHFHGREPGTGAPRLTDVELNLRALRLIAESTPLIAYPTYGDAVRVLDYYDINSPAPERYTHFIAAVREPDVRLEVGPVDLGSIGANARWDAATGRMVPTSGTNLNSGRDHEWMVKFCLENRLKITFATFDAGDLRNLRNVLNWGFLKEPPYVVKFFFGGEYLPFGLRPTARSLRFCLDETEDLPLQWTPVVYQGDPFPLSILALELGGHVRVGIGDFPRYRDGAPTNAQLVERVVQLARALGREPATPDEVREMWGINAARAGKQ